MLGALAVLSIGAAACETKGIAYGDVNSVIAVMSPELWDEVSEDVYAALEPTIRTVRDEKTFTVTYQQAFAENWSDMRRFRQILIVGSATDVVIVEALERSNEEVSQFVSALEKCPFIEEIDLRESKMPDAEEGGAVVEFRIQARMI